MSLMCSCDYDYEPGQKRWIAGGDFSKMPTLSRRKRCCSCNKFIEAGSEVVKIRRFKVPETEIEIKFYGEDGEIPLASWFLCEKCGEIYLTLVEVGYECIYPPDTLDALEEYWSETGFDPARYKEIDQRNRPRQECVWLSPDLSRRLVLQNNLPICMTGEMEK